MTSHSDRSLTKSHPPKWASRLTIFKAKSDMEDKMTHIQETSASATRLLGEPIVEITNVDKWFGSNHVLKDVSLIVRQGEVVVLCGRSGSGKSTLLRCIDHLETIDDGSIRACGNVMGYRENLGGKRVELSDGKAAQQRREMGMVFQSFNLFPHLTVEQNVVFGLTGPVAAQRQRSGCTRIAGLGWGCGGNTEDAYPSQRCRAESSNSVLQSGQSFSYETKGYAFRRNYKRSRSRDDIRSAWT